MSKQIKRESIKTFSSLNPVLATFAKTNVSVIRQECFSASWKRREGENRQSRCSVGWNNKKNIRRLLGLGAKFVSVIRYSRAPKRLFVRTTHTEDVPMNALMEEQPEAICISRFFSFLYISTVWISIMLMSEHKLACGIHANSSSYLRQRLQFSRSFTIKTKRNEN